LYVLCAFDEREKSEDENERKQAYGNDFWIQDIIDTFERIFILAKYDCKPYIMRYKEYLKSKYKGIYINLAAWGNQPHLVKKMAFKQFSVERGMSQKVYKQYKGRYDDYLNDGYEKGSCWLYAEEFEKEYPEIAGKYFNLTYEMLSKIVYCK
jgi:hypothetical protein